MNELIVALRLFTLTVCALTMLACAVRPWFSKDVRARWGNVAFGGFAGIAWLSQAAYLDASPSLFTWLLLANTIPCIAYLVTLARKGL